MSIEAPIACTARVAKSQTREGEDPQRTDPLRSIARLSQAVVPLAQCPSRASAPSIRGSVSAVGFHRELRAFQSAQRAYDAQEHPDYYDQMRRRLRTVTLANGEEISEADVDDEPNQKNQEEKHVP